MAKSFLIPHNYTNNGRIFNMFDKKKLTWAVLWFIPSTVAMFFLPLKIEDIIFWWVLISPPPAIAILAGYGDYIRYFILFMANRRIYYDVKRRDANGFLYLQYKDQKNQN